MKSWGSPKLVVPGLIAVVVSSCLVQNPTCLNLSWLQEHYWYSGAWLAWNCGNKWGPSRASSLQTASTNCIPPVVEILLLRQMNSCLPPPPSSLALSSFLSKLGFWLSLPQQKLQLHFSGKLLLNPKSAIKDCWTAVLPSPSESCWQPAFHHLQIFVDHSAFFCHDITSNLYWCMCICIINKFCLFYFFFKKKKVLGMPGDDAVIFSNLYEEEMSRVVGITGCQAHQNPLGWEGCSWRVSEGRAVSDKSVV